MRLSINLNKSLEQNASHYFDISKKAKKKLDGLEKFLQSLPQIKEKKVEEKIIRKQEWYERFRWFTCSNRMLVIGGRDAKTNEEVIKKHALPHDIVFHTDMAGSPFMVLQTKGKDVDHLTLEQCIQVTACYSRAWGKGFTTTPTFWVKPDQVTKQANSGESLGTGAFVIRGKTNYIDPKMELVVGLLESGQIVVGTRQSVKAQTSQFVTIVPGNLKPSDVAKEIRKRLGGGDLDEIVRMIPSGKSRLTKG